MKESLKPGLKPGLEFEFNYTVGEEKPVPHFYPDISEALIMPKVFATGFMVGLIEFACVKAINPHIDWPNEQSVGIGINVKHMAATPPGSRVTVKVRLDKVDGRKLSFSVKAFDDLDQISEGTHQRFVVNAAKFNAAVAEKASRISPASPGRHQQAAE